MTKDQKLKEITERMHELCRGLTAAACKLCDGRGWNPGHNAEDPHEYGCSSCPIQEECDPCRGSGLVCPIHLEDLQLALFRSGFTYVSTHTNADGKSVTVNVERIDESAGWNHWATCTGFDWLLKTPMELQSEETIEKLHSLFTTRHANYTS